MNSVVGLVTKTVIIVLVSAAAVVALAAWIQSPAPQSTGSGAIKVIMMPSNLTASSETTPDTQGYLSIVSEKLEKTVSFTLSDFSRSTALTIDNLIEGVYKINVTIPNMAIRTLLCGAEGPQTKVTAGLVSNCVAYFLKPGVALAAELTQAKCEKDTSCERKILQLNPQYNLLGKKVTCGLNKDKCQCFIDGQPALFGNENQNTPVLCAPAPLR